MTFGAVCTFPGWLEEVNDETGDLQDVKPFPSRHTRHFATVAAGISALLMFIAALWQHTASVSTACIVEKFIGAGIVTHVGTAPTVLAWLSVVVVTAVFLSLLSFCWSIYVLDLVTNKE